MFISLFSIACPLLDVHPLLYVICSDVKYETLCTCDYRSIRIVYPQVYQFRDAA